MFQFLLIIHIIYTILSNDTLGFSVDSKADLGYKLVSKKELGEIKKKFENWTWRMFKVPKDFSSGIVGKIPRER